MAWIPIGPDFVSKLRQSDVENTKRISRYNQTGRNGWMSQITIHPNNPNVICALARPSFDGRTAFRSIDAGKTWMPIVDQLKRNNPHVDPMCLAHNPDNYNIIYMGTFVDRGFYVSNDGGVSWSSKRTGAKGLRKIIVDMTSISNGIPRIYAAGTGGLFLSDDEGMNWTNIISDIDCDDFAAHIPATGKKRFYICARKKGLLYSETPDVENSWHSLAATRTTNLPLYRRPRESTANVSAIEASFISLRIGICQRNPARAYVWYVKASPGDWKARYANTTLGIYTQSTDDPFEPWIKMLGTNDIPGPEQSEYNFEFGVAPNSPGDGTNDILFIGNRHLHRSIDSGRNWTKAGQKFHLDIQGFAFAPTSDLSGIPIMYLGCDGGLCKSTMICDPQFDFAEGPSHFGGNEDNEDSDNGWFENLNHNRQDPVVISYSSHSKISALSFISCQDTGVSGGAKSLVWKSITDGDAYEIAMAPGYDGVKVWSFNNGQMMMYTVIEESHRTIYIEREPNIMSSIIHVRSNLSITPNNECIVGGAHWRSNGTLTEQITVGQRDNLFSVTDMTDIRVGTILRVDAPVDPNRARVLPIGKEQTIIKGILRHNTIRARLTNNHAAGIAVGHYEHRVYRVSQDGVPTAISSAFLRDIKIIAVHPTNENIMACATWDEDKKVTRVWKTNIATTANDFTDWSEITRHKPTDPKLEIVSLAIKSNGRIYALLQYPVSDNYNGIPSTPLFALSTSWVGQPCDGNPIPGVGLDRFSNMVFHPAEISGYRGYGHLFISCGARVYRAISRRTSGARNRWVWKDISDDSLPGTWIYQLWVGYSGKNIRTTVLRAATISRGVWELLPDLSNPIDSIPELFVRDHILDQGIGRMETGMANPYDPNQVLGYDDCPDIKIEGILRHSTLSNYYFQSGLRDQSAEISHADFELLQESQSPVRGGFKARIHIQIHNRSSYEARGVRAWIIYADVSRGIPELWPDFAEQFLSSGQIVPNVPSNSPWSELGEPRSPSGQITPDKPGIVSWQWDMPRNRRRLGTVNYAFVVFINSPDRRLWERTLRSLSVHEIVQTNRQVGLKIISVSNGL